jgi:predicted phosphodiesterase
VILHLGDLGTSTKALDILESVAPLRATRGGNNSDDERVTETMQVVNAGDFRIGMVFDLASLALEAEFIHAHEQPETHRLQFAPDVDIPERLQSKFGAPVEVVAFAATHAPYIGTHQGVLFINPGSPTFPEPGAEPAGVVKHTIGVLEIDGPRIEPATIEIEI